MVLNSNETSCINVTTRYFYLHPVLSKSSKPFGFAAYVFEIRVSGYSLQSFINAIYFDGKLPDRLSRESGIFLSRGSEVGSGSRRARGSQCEADRKKVEVSPTGVQFTVRRRKLGFNVKSGVSSPARTQSGSRLKSTPDGSSSR